MDLPSYVAEKVHEPCTERIASLEVRLSAAEERERVYREALERIDAELGMPGRGFPASVANDCWEIALKALATASGEGEGGERADPAVWRAGEIAGAEPPGVVLSEKDAACLLKHLQPACKTGWCVHPQCGPIRRLRALLDRKGET